MKERRGARSAAEEEPGCSGHGGAERRAWPYWAELPEELSDRRPSRAEEVVVVPIKSDLAVEGAWASKGWVHLSKPDSRERGSTAAREPAA